MAARGQDVEALKRELVLRRLKKSAAPRKLQEPAAPIGRAPCGNALPLSLQQQRLWFIDRLKGAGAAYHLSGTLSSPAGTRSLQFKSSRAPAKRSHSICPF